VTGESGNEQLRELVERAAAPKPAAEPEAAKLPMIAVRIGVRWLALPAGAVREVVTLDTITRVPGVPDLVVGLALIRGRLVPVVDLPRMLHTARSGDAAITRPRLVVLARGEHEVGIVAVETRGVLELPPATAGTTSGLVRGELRWNANIVAVLDTDAIVDVVAAGTT
jgi:chemotaxis signal transduction protein